MTYMILTDEDVLRIVSNETSLQKQISNTLRKEQEDQVQTTQVKRQEQTLNSLVYLLHNATIISSIIEAYQTQTQNNVVTILTDKVKIRVTDMHVVQEA